MPEAFDRGRLYQMLRLPNGWFVHAPCAVRGIEETQGQVSFTLDGWGESSYHLLVSGMGLEEAEWQGGAPPIKVERPSGQNIMVATMKGKQRVHELADPNPFLAEVKALMDAGTDLDAESKPRKTPVRKKKVAPRKKTAPRKRAPRKRG